jgi:chromosome segregation ATPase
MFIPTKFLDKDSDSGGSAQSDNSSQQDYQKLYEEQKGRYDKDIAAAEKRRIGLQQTYQTEQDAHKATKTALEQVNEQLKALTSEKGSLSEKFSKLETEFSEQGIEMETLKRQNSRAKLIFGKFPELASFEADGLLPEAEENKLEEVFGKFREKLGAIKEQGKEEFGKGGTPTKPSPTAAAQPEGRASLLKQLAEATQKGDMKLFNEIQDKLMKLPTT